MSWWREPFLVLVFLTVSAYLYRKFTSPSKLEQQFKSLPKAPVKRLPRESRQRVKQKLKEQGLLKLQKDE